MLSLVYVSSAATAFNEQDLVQILKDSRENNTKAGITGMLLYKDGNIMQAIEGPDEAVHNLYEVISKDPRHLGIIKLIEYPIDSRQFPEWSMAFRNLKNGELQKMDGYSEFMNDSFTSQPFRTDPTRAKKLLLMFRQTM